MAIKFTCPLCGTHRIEEVMTGVTVSSEITTLHTGEGLGDCEYASSCNEGGEVDRFQCMNCGYAIKDCMDLKDLVTALENLAEVQRRDEKRGLYPEHIDDAN